MRGVATSNLVLGQVGRARHSVRAVLCTEGGVVATVGAQRTARPTTSFNVAHAPEGLVAVFADKQAAVFGDGDSDRAAPDFAFGRDEAGQAAKFRAKTR